MIQEKYSDANASIISIGKKASEHFQKNGPNVISSHDTLFSDITFDNVAKIAEDIMNQFAANNYDKVILVYNQFKNAATQIIMSENFLPIQTPENEGVVVGDYLFEPTKQEILEQGNLYRNQEEYQQKQKKGEKN